MSGRTLDAAWFEWRLRIDPHWPLWFAVASDGCLETAAKIAARYVMARLPR